MSSSSQRDQFDQYIRELVPGDDDVLRQIQANAAAQDMPSISIQPHEGHLLNWLVRLCGARLAVEIGTLAGYSGTWLARALPPDGHLHTIDINEAHVHIAREHFSLAGLANRVTVHHGDANEVLPQLSAQGPFDLVFLDADKPSNPAYYAWAVDNLRPGGLLLAHNAYRHGGVLDPQDESARTTVTFTRELMADSRLQSVILPLGDGFICAMRQ